MMRRRGSRRRRDDGPPEINVTAFLNLMVVLVPFLLITAVFSRLTILQLDLPKGAGGDADKPDIQVEVIVRDEALALADGRAVIKRLPNTEEGYDLEALRQLLLEIKSNYPEKRDARILLEPDIKYDVLVTVMDAVQSTQVMQAGSLTRIELFPQVSIGDAPVQGAARHVAGEVRA